MNKYLILSFLFSVFLADTLLSCRKKDLPVIITDQVTEVKGTSAVCGGTITSNGGSFITSKGVCWSTEGNPSISSFKTIDGSGNEEFSSLLIGLKSETAYHVRAYATNSVGTSYGDDMSFNTRIADTDDNMYTSVKIGTQTWMVENLRTTKFNDGMVIQNVTSNEAWAELTTAAYCWYMNDEAWKPVYGALYNWYAVNTGKLCPTGWHVPTREETMILIDNLGGGGIAGGKLKETGTTHWKNPNTGATNESGFTGLPGGYRVIWGGVFGSIGELGIWWSSTESGDSYAHTPLNLYNYFIEITSTTNDKHTGSSVRCLKD